MGLPNVNIEFLSKAVAAVKQGTMGLLAIVIKDASVATGVDQYDLGNVADVPASLSESNKKFILDAFLGLPKTVKVVVLPDVASDYSEALNRLETIAFDTVAFPGAIESDMAALGSWVKSMREGKDKKIIAVLANHAGDHEGIVNLSTSDIDVSGTKMSATDYTARIAGLISGLPLTVAPTFRVLPEVDDVPKMTKAEADAKIDAGELVLYHDGEKVKIARGMTSLTSSSKSAEWKKIKLVRIYDKVYSDIKRTIEDYYIGATQNSYSNKLLLVNAINGYLETLENANILDRGKNACMIDLEAQRTYLKSIGMDTDGMDEQTIKEANTRDQVFLSLNIKALDAIEDVALKIII